jgi:hypothetical protein
LRDLLGDSDPAMAGRMLQAIRKISGIEIAELNKAAQVA